MKLSKTQRLALECLANRPVTDIDRLIHISRKRKTMDILVELGLANWHPYAEKGQGAWKITAEGKKFYLSMTKNEKYSV